MKKKKGFTLVELLAVIVILAVILVIAVPQIMSVIESARKGSIESTAKLIAEGAEREYTNRKILGKDTNIECSDVSSMNSNDYGTCVITFDNTGKATVKVTGKGKFEGYTCNGNSTNMKCVKGEIPESTETAAQYFSYSEVEVVKTADVTIKDKNKCESYLASKFNIPDDDEEGKKLKETVCAGGIYEGSMSSLVSSGNIPSRDYETAGIEVNWIIINNVTVKDKNKCVAYLLSTIENPSDTQKEYANTLCSGNALDNGKTLTDAVQEGVIPPSDYETAGLEVTSKQEEIIITGYNSGFSVEITDQEKCKAYVKENNITNDSLAEMLCAGKSYTKIDSYVSNNSIPKSDYKIAGLEVTYKNGGGPDVVIPSMIDGKKVIRIEGKGSFAEKGITSLVIPNTVTSIGNYAFAHNQLTEVTIPNSVIDIEDDAFRCNQITSLTLSNGVKTIGAFAFEHNKLTEVTLPSSVTNINESAFAYNKLTSINFPTTPLNLKCSPFHDNPITKDGTYTYPDNVTVVECILS